MRRTALRGAQVLSDNMSTNKPVDGRTRHYGTFYDLDPVDRADTAGQDDGDDDRPLLLVWGNCQAEAIRVLLCRFDRPCRRGRFGSRRSSN